MNDDLLSQEEIDALLNDVSGEEKSNSNEPERFNGKLIRRFDPSTQQRTIRTRLQDMDTINESFARRLRITLEDLLRRGGDISIKPQQLRQLKKYSDFARALPVPSSINLISMAPLVGSTIIVFPPELILITVDSLFGGDGRLALRAEGRDFTRTEQRIINRIVESVLQTYQEAWEGFFPITPAHQRSETQARFANIVDNPSELVVDSTFRLEFGTFECDFHICMPYSMIEPISGSSSSANEDEQARLKRLSQEVTQSDVELIAHFADIKASIGQLMTLKRGDILPIELPIELPVNVDGVAVMTCGYGTIEERKALRVNHLIDHHAPGGIDLAYLSGFKRKAKGERMSSTVEKDSHS